MNGHAVEDRPAEEKQKLPKYVQEEREARGSFTMDMKGPVRPLDLGEDEGGGSRTPRQRRLLLALGLLVLLVVALVICLVVVVIRLEDIEEMSNICETEDCIRSADNLIQSMDQNVAPCNDFYKFACGRWAEDHPLPDAAYSNDWFAETNTLINQQIQDFLETNDSDEDAIVQNQARKLYRGCMDTEQLDEQGLEPMLQAAERMGLGAVPAAALAAAGGGSALEEEEHESGLPEGWSLEKALAAAERALGLDVFVGLDVVPAPQNRSFNLIMIGCPSTAPILPGYPEVVSPEASSGSGPAPGARRLHRSPDWLRGKVPDDGDSRKRRRRRRHVNAGAGDALLVDYAAKVLELSARYAAGEGNPAVGATTTPRNPRLLRMAASIARIEGALESIMENNQSKLMGVQPDIMTAKELQEELDAAAKGTFKINVAELLTRLFDGLELQLEEEAGEEQDLLLVYDRKYLKRLAAFLSGESDKNLQIYVWWKVVSTLAPYTNSEMRILKERYLQDVTASFSPESRPHFCASLVNELMGMAVARFFYDEQLLNTTRTKMGAMFADIRWAFEARVGVLDWMDDETKAATLQKVAAMSFFVGFPDWLADDDVLKEYYGNITVEEESFMVSMLSILDRASNNTLLSLREFNDIQDGWGGGPPMETNAAHFPYLNSVVAPAGILQFPFFLLGLDALNYGAIGSILGHELTHGFDDQGRKYDPEGNMIQWWTNATIEEYENKTKCFVDQYSRYELKEISEHVDGQETLGENIADNGGLAQAFRAYRRRRERAGVHEQKLPGLEKYNGEQLFFLSFANVWCEKWTKQSLRNNLVDEHAPNQLRVQGVLVNSPDFAEVWKCPKGSHMNPKRDRCIIW